MMVEQPIDPRRALAIKRIEEKHGFRTHVFVYAVVNGMLVLIWYFTGAGFFWPIFPLAVWGIGLIIHAYTAYYGNVYTEREVRKEMEKLPEDASEIRLGK
jgi:hypothetical protein